MAPALNKKKTARRRRKAQRTKAVDYNSDSSSDMSCLSHGDDENANTMTFDPLEFRRIHLDFVARLKKNKSIANVNDVDRCFKKIHEGLETVVLMWERFDAAPTSTVKEKLEHDLKREIKKLQRLREQVRSWIALETGIKDQSALLFCRSIIEVYMNKFKNTEKEMRIKPFSHVGLSQTGNMDPLEVEAENLEKWIKKILRKLALNIDEAESQIEKNGQDINNVQELQDWIQKYQYHTSELEAMLRLLNALRIDEDEAKEKLPTLFSQVDELKDALDNFIKDHKKPGFKDGEYPYESIDGLADIKKTALDLLLPLDGSQMNAENDSGVNPEESTELSEERPITSELITSEGPSSDSNAPSPERSFKELHVESSDSVVEAIGSLCSRDLKTAPDDSVLTKNRRGEVENHPFDTEEKSISPSRFNRSGGSPTEQSHASSPIGPGYQMNQNVRTPSPPPRAYSAPGAVSMAWQEPSKEFSPRLVAPNSEKEVDQVSPRVAASNWRKQKEQLISGTARIHLNLPSEHTMRRCTVTSEKQSNLPRKEMSEIVTGTTGTNWNLSRDKMDKIPAETTVLKQNLTSQQFASFSQEKAHVYSDEQGAESLNWYKAQAKKVPAPQPCSSSQDRSRYFPIHLSDVKDPCGGVMSEEGAALFKTAYIPKDLAANPCGPVPYTEKHKRDLLRLNAAHDQFNIFADDFCALAPLDRVFPRTPFPTPSYYPQVNLDIKTYENMPDETLCFAFFNHAGTQMQILVAKILQAREFRFYKKEGTWFRREIKPVMQTSYYERGSYVKFCLEKKEFVPVENFFFEYQYLVMFE